MNKKAYREDYENAETIIEDPKPDRAVIATAAMAALIMKGTMTKSVIPKEAVEFADKLMDELLK